MADPNLVQPMLSLTDGVAQQWVGGAGCVIVSGGFGGGTLQLSFSDDGLNFIPMDGELSDVAMVPFALPRNAWIMATFTGGPLAVNVKVYREAGMPSWTRTQNISGGGGGGGDVNIASFGGSAVSKGQHTKAQSIGVTLASDEDALSFAPADMLSTVGTIASAAVLSNFPIADTSAYHAAAVQFTTVTAGNTAVAEESNDGTTWTTVVALDGSASVSAVGLKIYNISGKQFRIRCSVYASGSVAVTSELRAFPRNWPTEYGAGNVSARTWRVTLASDQAAVPVTGAFFQATQPVSLANLPALAAGTAVIGKVGIDQTTDGTTNLVAAKQSGSWAVSVTGSVAVTGTFFQATQPVSAAALPLPTGASTETTLAAVNTKLGGTLAVSGVFWQATQPVSIAATVATAGPTAAASALTANPLTIGGRAATANPTAATDGNVVNASLDKVGRQLVRTAIRTLKGMQQTQLSASTTETTIVTAVASEFHDLYGLILANTGASATKVSIRDDTAGTVRAVIQVPAGETRGFMLPADAGLPQTAVNKNWTAQCGTSTTALEVTAMFTKEL